MPTSILTPAMAMSGGPGRRDRGNCWPILSPAASPRSTREVCNRNKGNVDGRESRRVLDTPHPEVHRPRRCLEGSCRNSTTREAERMAPDSDGPFEARWLDAGSHLRVRVTELSCLALR